MSEDGDVTWTRKYFSLSYSLKYSLLTFPLDDQALLVILSGRPAGLQHEGVHSGADLSGCDGDVVSDTGAQVNPPDGV